MKNLFFTIIISFLSLNIFAQNSQSDKFDNLTVPDKLNYLYNNMLDKHIKDFKRLEDEIKTLKFKLANNTSSKFAQKNKNFSDSIKILNTLLSNQQKQINQKTDLLEKANQSNKRASNSIIKLESQIKNEIRLITNFEGVLDPDLIRSVENKAKENNISTKNLSKLINLNQKIIKAENILSNPINKTSVTNYYNSLDEIKYIPSDWYQYKISSLKQLLGNYCSITSDIYNSFIFLDDLGLDEHIRSTKNDIMNKKILVINYPFLAKELDKKINNIKYVSKVTGCN